MSWVGSVPAFAAAAVVLLGPGLIALAPLRMGILARVSVAGLVSVVCLGGAATVAGALGIAFAAWYALAPALVGLAAAWLIRRASPARVVSPLTAPPLAIAGAWLAGAAVIAVVALAGVAGPERISQTYDNVFHLSAAASILDGGSGSPLTLRSLIETADAGIAYYPSGWHLIAVATSQVSGASIPVAFHAAWLAVAALAWVPGVAWCAQVVLPRTRRDVAVVCALFLAAAFGAFPYSLLAWGTIYPTFLAHALLPAACATGVLVARGAAEAPPGRRARAILVGSAALAVALGALAVAHPRVLPTWAVLVAPFVVWLLAAVVRRGWCAGGSRRRATVRALVAGGALAAAALAAGAVYAVGVLGLFDEPLENRLEGPQAAAVQGVGAGVAQVLLQQFGTGVGTVTGPAIVLAALIAAGIGALVRRGSARWLIVAFAIAAALYVLAAGSDGAVAKLATGVWYKDRFRIAASLPVVAVPLAAWGAVALGRLAARATARGRRVAAFASVGFAAVAVVASGLVLALTGTTAAIAAVFAQPAERAEWAVISAAQQDFFDTVVRETVPADQRVLGDPWDGSALTGLYADREPVFPHVNGQWDADRLALAWHLEDIEDNPDVCRALDALRVRYVLYDPHEFGGGDPSGNHFPGPHRAVEAGLFERVATDGVTELYRIDQCGELPAG
ncbi:DUF6541 family protein [Microbacterium sp. ZXX196]|uniref:DUF6541 family protein n=1 Tax=Microbacterium sp. ZXX196 TaxID=2609291 RepID=UPI0012BA1647|nr:DUF6541 family protein [Microbacterium sp. ZXX196]MTE22734.1 hypothetical protein [Microbacterium sp. ZXX196]